MKKKTGFYIFLFLCMIGLGVSAFFINNARTRDGEKVDNANTSSVIIRSQIDLTSALSSAQTSSKELDVSSEEPVSSEDQSQTEAQSQTAVAAQADFFVYPLSGEIITDFSKDGLVFSKTYGDWRSHNAIDIKGNFGESVHASGDGTVEEVYYDELYGNTMVIDHGNGIKIHYCGLDETYFKAGQTVLANDTIATLGDLPCENLDGVHLHLAVEKDSEYINPLDIIS